jgi:hypothetical protein
MATYNMILGVNGIRLVGKRSGVGRAIEAVLRFLDEVDHPFNDVRVYTPLPLGEDVVLPSCATNVVLRSSLSNALWEQITLLKAHGARNLLFCPSYVIPLLAKCPTLLVHHGSYEGYPKAFDWWTLNKARAIYTASAWRATSVSTVSESSKRDMVRFYGIVNGTFGGFLRAQLIQGLIYGLATALVMSALGLDYVALASVLAAIVVLAPIIGSVLGAIPPLLIVLIEKPDRFLLMLIILVIVQQVLFNMIMPRLMGRIVGLHPLLVFAAILVGATVAGGWGILFGIPIAGVVASVLQFIYSRATGEGAIVIGGANAPNPVGWWLYLPSNILAGTYTSTLTMSVVAGP